MENKNEIRNEIALIRDFERIDADWLGDHQKVKVIASPTTGIDHIDEIACEYAEVKIVSLGTGRERDSETKRFLRSVTSTAELSFFLMLSLSRNVKSALNGKRELGHKLRGKTLGIVGGLGRIGSQMKPIAKAFGMRICCFDNKRSWGRFGGNSLSNLLRESDFVSIHIPMPGNEGFWGSRHFKLMKPTAYFINTSRSAIVEHGALLSALRDGEIAGAAVDFMEDIELVVYAKEHDNLILTNHLGGATVEDRAATDAFILKKAKACLSH